MEKIVLNKPSILKNGIRKVQYPIQQFNLAGEIERLLIEKGFLKESVPLINLHKHLDPSVMQRFSAGTETPLQMAFYETSKKFQELYFGLIQHIASDIFDFDFIFQTVPNIRFHFPGPVGDEYRSKEGVYLGMHSDTLNGHPFEEVNCWLPLTDCYATSALYTAPLEESIALLSDFCEDINYNARIYHKCGWDLFYMKANSNKEFQKRVFASCKPLPMQYGEILFFDPRVIHGPVENVEDVTRISLDFRILPTHVQLTREYTTAGRGNRKLIRGDVFYKDSARELGVPQ